MKEQIVSYLIYKGLRLQHAFIKKNTQLSLTYYNALTTGHSLATVGILSMLPTFTLHMLSTAFFILNSSLNLALLVSQETC